MGTLNCKLYGYSNIYKLVLLFVDLKSLESFIESRLIGKNYHCLKFSPIIEIITDVSFFFIGGLHKISFIVLSLKAPGKMHYFQMY